MSRTQQGSSDWYQLDGTAGADEFHMVSYHIYAGVDLFKMTSVMVTEILRLPVDFDDAGFLVQEQLAKFNVAAFVDTGVNFDVRLYNLTDAVLLATLNFSETTPTTKSGTFVLPDGTKDIVLEFLRGGGVPASNLYLRHVAMTWLVSP